MENDGQASPILAKQARNTVQPQLGLEAPKPIGNGRTTPAELRSALYQFIPSSGKIRREEVLEKASAHIGRSLKKARSDLNRIIANEKQAGKLGVDSGWENLWRV